MLTENDVRRLLEKLDFEIDVNAIPVDGDFAQYGMDSLDIYDVILQLQELSGRDVPDSDVDKLKSIQDIILYFKQ